MYERVSTSLRYYIVVEYDDESHRPNEKRTFGLKHTIYLGIHESLRQTSSGKRAGKGYTGGRDDSCRDNERWGRRGSWVHESVGKSMGNCLDPSFKSCFANASVRASWSLRLRWRFFLSSLMICATRRRILVCNLGSAIACLHL